MKIVIKETDDAQNEPCISAILVLRSDDNKTEEFVLDGMRLADYWKADVEEFIDTYTHLANFNNIPLENSIDLDEYEGLIT